MNLGEVIKNYRLEHRMSQEEFARLSNLSKAYIGFLEAGVNPKNNKEIDPSITTIVKCAKAMNVNPASLINLINKDNLRDEIKGIEELVEIEAQEKNKKFQETYFASKQNLINTNAELSSLLEKYHDLILAYKNASPEIKEAVERILKIEGID